ncbi:MAG: Holliday junction resolvase RuvX [Verrucomicrobiales bacterium]
MRALGIDPGEARTGVSLSDPLGVVARPLETIHRESTPHPETRVAELARQHAVEVVVIGLPVRMDGREGTAAAKARAWAEKLRALLPSEVRIEFADERLTTVEADQHLRRAGKRDHRERKAVIDQTAATVLLQHWLDQHAGPALLPPDL